MTLTICPTAVIDQTLASLRADGVNERESVVLWLGKRTADDIHVVEAFRPKQVASSHYFRIPEDAMDALRQRLRRDRLMVAAQVHSHPEDAFHSATDDLWAIVRHEGALSLVVPDFATGTTTGQFLDTTKVFRLSTSNEWLEVESSRLARCLTIR